jgi:hypothetical protein
MTVDQTTSFATRAVIAQNAIYEGSAEHKFGRYWAGQGKLRSDGTPCPRGYHDQAELTRLLRLAIANGQHSPIEAGDTFPKYVWAKDQDYYFAARLINREQGNYKGYPVLPSEFPNGLK